MKNNEGSLWIQNKKNERSPIIGGYIKVNDEVYRIAVWKNKRKTKETDADYYCMLTLKQERKKESKKFDDDIPF